MIREPLTEGEERTRLAPLSDEALKYLPHFHSLKSTRHQSETTEAMVQLTKKTRHAVVDGASQRARKEQQRKQASTGLGTTGSDSIGPALSTAAPRKRLYLQRRLLHLLT